MVNTKKIKILVSLFFLCLGFCRAGHISDALEVAFVYCDNMKLATALEEKAEENATIIGEFFSNSFAKHFNDIEGENNMDIIPLDAYLRLITQKYKGNLKIEIQILAHEAREENCAGVFCYLIPVNKKITFIKEQKVREFRQIIYVNKKLNKIQNVYSDDPVWCKKVTNPEDRYVDIEELIKQGIKEYAKEKHLNAEVIFKRVLRIDSNNQYASIMLSKIQTDLEAQLNNAIDMAYSGSTKKMKKAFDIIYANMEHPIVKKEKCIYFFMANMIFYKKLDYKLTEEQEAECLKIFIRRACAANCSQTQEFLESLKPSYRTKYDIKCR